MSADEQFESLGQERIIAVNSRERRNFNWMTSYKCWFKQCRFGFLSKNFFDDSPRSPPRFGMDAVFFCDCTQRINRHRGVYFFANGFARKINHPHATPRFGKIKFGATVKLVDEDSEEEKIYQIVGDQEADVKAGRISISSPIARAMIGKEMGDVVEVNTPGGVKAYEILKVEWL